MSSNWIWHLIEYKVLKYQLKNWSMILEQSVSISEQPAFKTIISAAKREQLLTKVLSFLHLYGQSKKIVHLQISIAGITTKEFTFFVTPVFASFKVSQQESKDIDFSLSLKDEKSKLEDVLSRLDDEKEKEIEIYIENQNWKYFKKELAQSDRVLRKIITIEFPEFRCGVKMIKIEDLKFIKKKKTKISRQQSLSERNVESLLNSFFNQISVFEQPKQIYELMSRYGYFLDTQKVNPAIILFKDICDKYKNKQLQLFRQHLYNVDDYGWDYFTHIEYPSLVTGAQICCWISQTEFYTVVSKNAYLQQKKPNSRFKTFNIKIKKYPLISRTINNYILSFQRKIIELRLSKRIVQFVKLRLKEDEEVFKSQDPSRQRYCLEFTYEFNHHYKQLFSIVQKELYFTNFKIDPKLYSLDFNNSLLINYLQTTFNCYITLSKQEVRCFILLRYSEQIMNFLKENHMSHNYFFPLENLQYWSQKLKPSLDQQAKKIGFSFKFQRNGLDIQCTSKNMFQQIKNVINTIKDDIVKDQLKINKENEKSVLKILKTLAQKYSSVDIKVVMQAKDLEIQKTKVINLPKLVLTINQINSTIEKDNDINFSLFFESNFKAGFFHYFDTFDQSAQSISQVCSKITKLMKYKQKSCKILLKQSQIYQLSLVIKKIQSLQENLQEGICNNRFTMNIFTQSPDNCSASLQQYLKCSDSDQTSKTIIIQGLSWEVKQIMNQYRSYYSNKTYKGSIKKLSRDFQMDLRKFAIGTNCDIDFQGDEFLLSSDNKMEVNALLSKWLSFTSVR